MATTDAGAALHQVRQRGADRQEDAGQVHADHALPLLGQRWREPCSRRRCRRWPARRRAARSARAPPDGALERGRVGHVGGERELPPRPSRGHLARASTSTPTRAPSSPKRRPRRARDPTPRRSRAPPSPPAAAVRPSGAGGHGPALQQVDRCPTRSPTRCRGRPRRRPRSAARGRAARRARSLAEAERADAAPRSPAPRRCRRPGRIRRRLSLRPGVRSSTSPSRLRR